MGNGNEYQAIAAQYAKAKAAQEQGRAQQQDVNPPINQNEEKFREFQFSVSHGIVVALLLLFLILHGLGFYLFTSGFLLSRLVLSDRSQCAEPPVPVEGYTVGSFEKGCWHPKTFEKAVVIIVDALRYDFTVPFKESSLEDEPRHFHNALPLLYELSKDTPANALLLPFIADPPTTTLQRLKGLTTGTLPTFIDAGSNFAGTAIDEDNIIEQLHHAGKRVVHLGDDTWHALFPGYFEPNLTKPFDSFNVWDLHTVDNGVTEHLLPLLDKSNVSKWDVIIGHYLGVDHAGHRYGPDHPAMAAKLRQMNEVITKVARSIDDSTLLVVMGDHGMDQKGDHGGESDDEVEAAIWFFSKRPVFGRQSSYRIEPPATAKERPVAQIDLVPTLSLLLGLPIPFNNLGAPIEELFIGVPGNHFDNLAAAFRLTTAQIHRYMSSYSKLRKLEDVVTAEPQKLWSQAAGSWSMVKRIKRPGQTDWKSVTQAYSRYQKSTLHLCRSLWARFSIPSMVNGISILSLLLVVLIVYASGIRGSRIDLNPIFLVRGALATGIGAALGVVIGSMSPALPFMQTTTYLAAMGGILGILSGVWTVRSRLQVPIPKSIWSIACVTFTLLLSVGFASNSFTIWEDRILPMFLASFGAMMFGSSMRQTDITKRALGCYYSILFVVLGRIASLSMLCREEQMPYCKTTFYASSTSSTSAAWQLLIPFATAIVLPEIIKAHFKATGSYQGSAVLWIGLAFRIGALVCALFWTLDTADDNDWLNMEKARLKTFKVAVAQIALIIALPAGYSTFSWSPPFLDVSRAPARAIRKNPETPSSSKKGAPAASANPTTEAAEEKPQPIIIHGYSNLHGTRYFLLVTIWGLALLLLNKPMGSGALALCMWQILCLIEVLACTGQQNSSIGPVVLAFLGSFHYFTTGHQATLASIQWDIAFIPLRTVRYPWSPLLMALNTFGAQILCAIAVPAAVLWKRPVKTKGLLSEVAKAVVLHVVVYATIGLATTMWAGWLRRHLMLYRIFSPRFMMGASVLLVVELVAAVIVVGGTRWSFMSVGDIFGWP